jgi:uncharacterized protein (DUF952 family)
MNFAGECGCCFWISLTNQHSSSGLCHSFQTHDGRLLVDVLNHFYKDVKDDFLCLALDTTLLTSPVKMEDPAPVGEKSAEGGPPKVLFPHIFGPIEPLNCVTGEFPVLRGEDGTFLSVKGL